MSGQGVNRSKEIRGLRARLANLSCSRLEHLRKQGANRRKGTTEFQKKGQTARERLESFERDREFEDKEQAARKEPGSFRARANRSKETRELRKMLENMKTANRSKRTRIFHKGANRSKENREFRKKLENSITRNKTARKELRSFRARRNPLERDWRVSKETREFQNKEQTARKQLKNFTISEEGADRSNEAREFRNRLEDLKTRSKPLGRTRDFQNF